MAKDFDPRDIQLPPLVNYNPFPVGDPAWELREFFHGDQWTAVVQLQIGYRIKIAEATVAFYKELDKMVKEQGMAKPKMASDQAVAKPR